VRRFQRRESSDTVSSPEPPAAWAILRICLPRLPLPSGFGPLASAWFRILVFFAQGRDVCPPLLSCVLGTASPLCMRADDSASVLQFPSRTANSRFSLENAGNYPFFRSLTAPGSGPPFPIAFRFEPSCAGEPTLHPAYAAAARFLLLATNRQRRLSLTGHAFA